jgi:hypothetical protein
MPIYKVRAKVTRNAEVKVDAPNEEAAKKLGREKIERDDCVTPVQTPVVQIERVNLIGDDDNDIDHEDQG